MKSLQEAENFVFLAASGRVAEVRAVISKRRISDAMMPTLAESPSTDCRSSACLNETGTLLT